jgi:hypothetical protein
MRSGEWVGGQVEEAGGTATLWRAQLTGRAQEKALVERMAAACALEYEAISARARAAAELPDPDRDRMVQTLRRRLRQVTRRDFFPPPPRDQARHLVQALANGVAPRHSVTVAPDVEEIPS